MTKRLPTCFMFVFSTVAFIRRSLAHGHFVMSPSAREVLTILSRSTERVAARLYVALGLPGPASRRALQRATRAREVCDVSDGAARTRSRRRSDLRGYRRWHGR